MGYRSDGRGMPTDKQKIDKIDLSGRTELSFKTDALQHPFFLRIHTIDTQVRVMYNKEKRARAFLEG